MTSRHRLRLAPPIQPLHRARSYRTALSRFQPPTPPLLSPKLHSFPVHTHPIIPPSSFNPSLSIPPSTATAAPPAPIQTAAASTATHGGTSPSSRLLLPPSLSPPAFQPLSSHSHTSSTPHGVSKTIPGVIRPQTADSFRSELDDYLSLIIDLASRFGGNGFYSHHILFASQAAERLHQFNQGTHWGTLDIELYRRTFAARPSLHRDQCGAPSHPATTCSITPLLEPSPRT
ncbi:hypothetical protein D5F01_LYC12221 [Larimichthys crocea]|uniref:Uncharacterized protein n=1 Tax=Larimichthys crocea TaxID=215358 RepID=A0A6G0IAU2_LARCR|nr:hypothetical protein D5F01_LYC12221 [Larimichthys crocea]